jgi:hypothetical protein
LLALTGSAPAQVSVEVLMGNAQFLAKESIPVRVRITNNSGQTLRFGDDDWLSYSVESADGTVVMKTGDAPIPHDFQVKAAEMATTHADLAPDFNIFKIGRYTVTATVRIRDWDKTVTSAAKPFDIINGTKIWEQEFGVPQSPTNHSQPEVRKYILQQATLVERMKLYLRLTDASESKSFRVYPIGPMISFSNPQTKVDQLSNLHLLYQSGAHVYNYTVINPDGDIIGRQTYYYANSSPHLNVDETGKIQIEGGVRHFDESDVPSSRKAIATNDTPPHTP